MTNRTTRAEIIATEAAWMVQHAGAVASLKKAAEECTCQKLDLCQMKILMALLDGTATPEQQHLMATAELARIADEADTRTRMEEVLQLILGGGEGRPTPGGGH